MPPILVAHHEFGELRTFDPETGELGLDALPNDATDRIERLWPSLSRGRWQDLAGRIVVLYRVGTRLHFRAGATDIPLDPRVRMTLETRGSDNEVLVRQDGQELLRWQYHSKREEMVGSFIDPWESEDDLDLVVFAVEVASDEGRRQRMFATDEEIRLGDLTEHDLRTGARSAVAAVFPRARAEELRREVARWLWGWTPWRELRGCALCGGTEIHGIVMRVDRPRGALLPSFTLGGLYNDGAMVDAGICEDCLQLAQELLRPGAPRADAALADVERALRARGGTRDEEIAAALERRSALTPPDPVAAASCSFCREACPRCVRAPRAAICTTCLASALAEWRAHMDDFYRTSHPRGQPDDRWESAGYVFCFDGKYRLHVWLEIVENRPVEVLRSELAFWDPPWPVPIDAARREQLENSIAAVIRQKFGREVSFLD